MLTLYLSGHIFQKHNSRKGKKKIPWLTVSLKSRNCFKLKSKQRFKVRFTVIAQSETVNRTELDYYVVLMYLDQVLRLLKYCLGGKNTRNPITLN